MLMDFWGKLVSNNVKFLLDGVSNLIHFLFQTIKAAMLERKENHCLRQTCMSIILNLLPQLCSYQPTFSYMFFFDLENTFLGCDFVCNDFKNAIMMF